MPVEAVGPIVVRAGDQVLGVSLAFQKQQPAVPADISIGPRRADSSRTRTMGSPARSVAT